MSKVEVKFQTGQEQGPEKVNPGPVQEAVHTLFLTTVGALAWGQETAARCINSLAERGERIQEEGWQLMRDRMDDRRHQVRKIVDRRWKEAEAVEAELRTRLETILGRTGVPSRSDIEALSAKISALSKRLDELNSAQP